MHRRLIAIVFSLVLTASISLTAFAVVGSYNGETYKYGTQKSTSRVEAVFEYSDFDMLIHCSVLAEAWCSAHTEYVYGYDEVSSYGYCTARVDNSLYRNGYSHTCYIQSGYLTLQIGSYVLVPNQRF